MDTQSAQQEKQGQYKTRKRAGSHVALKVLLALLPALVFTQNYAWMTGNTYVGSAFIVIWALMAWSVWQLTEKNHILERLFRMTEISFFLLPVSALILTIVLGSQSDSAGAAVGIAIGGAFAVVLAFVVGLPGGIIMHIVSGKYDKKAESSGEKQRETLANKHGIILAIVGVFALAITLGSLAASNRSAELAEESAGLQQGGVQQEDVADQNGTRVSLEIVNKSFSEADFASSGSFQDKIRFDLKFTNQTDRDIRGVEGTVTFYDIFDNEIKPMQVSYDEVIPSGQSRTWKGGIDYNQFIDADTKLKNTKLENLKYKWSIETILYADGTSEKM